MNIEEEIKNIIAETLTKLGIVFSFNDIIVEISKEKIHGDFASNIAMKLARSLKKAPLLIANEISGAIKSQSIEKVEVAAPGFINFFIKSDSMGTIIQTIIDQNDLYGTSKYGLGKRINVEFVSANPTGDLHLGHARGAALGDVISRLYQACGFDVTREYYVNDAGNQIDNLAKSLYARYMQELGFKEEIPADGYNGEDIKKIASKLIKEDNGIYANNFDLNYFKTKGIANELEKINSDLVDFGVKFDKYSFETTIRSEKNIKKIFKILKSHIYVQEGATFLRTTDFGDDKDRVIVKSDGSYTYFLPDIVYHLDKLSRKFDLLIDILGADHHGYISRMKAALQIAGFSKDILEIEIIQMVRLLKDGQEVKMSKRTGVAVTMRELVLEVGIDAVRYFFVARAASSHLDFDLDLAKTNNASNPVYYAQYAHARLSSLLKSGLELGIDYSGQGLITNEEKDLMKHLASYPTEVLESALGREPYKITNYIQKLATYTHSFYTICRVIDKDSISLSKSRLGLVKASQIVMANALKLLGVTAPTKM